MLNHKFLRGLLIFLTLAFVTLVYELPAEPTPTTPKGESKAPKSLGQQYRECKDKIIQTEKEQGIFDVGARLELAIWALEENKDWLTPFAMQDIREIIKHEPDQPVARQLLGFFNYKNRWVTMDEFAKIKEDETEKLLSQIARLLALDEKSGELKSPPKANQPTAKTIQTPSGGSGQEPLRGVDGSVNSAKGESTPDGQVGVSGVTLPLKTPPIQNAKEGEQAELIKRFKEVEFAFKVRPLIKTLKNPSEDLAIFAVNELENSKEKIVIPYLVHASLIAEKDSVRNAALSAVKTLDSTEGVSWYGYYINKAGNSFNGLIRERGIQGLGELGGPESTSSLICTMYSVLLEIKFQAVLPTGTFPGLRSQRTQFTSPMLGAYGGGPLPPVSLMGSVNYELPDVRFMGIQTTIRAPAGGSISLENPLLLAVPRYNQVNAAAKSDSPVPSRNRSGLEYQVELCGNALEKVTGRKFGPDYEQWLAWYKESIKTKK